jgi:predicted membrane protein
MYNTSLTIYCLFFILIVVAFLKVFCFRNILKYIFFIFLNLFFIYTYQNNLKIQEKKLNQQKDQNILESGLERKNKPHLN